VAQPPVRPELHAAGQAAGGDLPAQPVLSGRYRAAGPDPVFAITTDFLNDLMEEPENVSVERTLYVVGILLGTIQQLRSELESGQAGPPARGPHQDGSG
jgi:hypothetical protein